jgi:hypothetical protein
MTDEEQRPDATEDEEPPRTPFDNPFFLPAMLWLFTAWFGWDAWIVPMEEHLRKGLHEHREDKEREAAENGAPPLS